MAPTPRQLAVATNALRADSRAWDQQSDELKQIDNRANGLTMDRLDAGVFQVYIASYQQATAEIIARCGEGETAMSDVASTLVHIANNYDRTEEANRSRFHR